jgi:hypothetical protein
MRSSAQPEDQTTRQWVGEVQASAGMDSDRSLLNGCGLVTMAHDEPFHASTIGSIEGGDVPTVAGSTVPAARQKVLDVQDTSCKVTDPETAGVGSSFHCVPSHCSTRPTVLESTSLPPTTMQNVGVVQETPEMVIAPGPDGRNNEVVGGAHTLPVHLSMTDTSPLVYPPTARQKLALVHEILLGPDASNDGRVASVLQL